MPYTTEGVQGRTYNINQPSAGTKTAVVFNHGYTGNADYVAGQLGNPDPDNYYLVFPNGVSIDPAEPNKRQWRIAGTLGSLSDIGFFADIYEDLKKLGVTDIYQGGHSNGAMMSYLMAAKHSEYLKGLFCVSGYLHNNISVAPGNIPIRHIHGLTDAVIPFSGVESSVETNMQKMITAGHDDFISTTFNNGHNLEELNQGGRLMAELEDLIAPSLI